MEINLQKTTISGERRLLVTARDITERKHGEEVLRDLVEAREQERKQFATILGHLVQGVMVVAADGTPLWANRAIVGLHGYLTERKRAEVALRQREADLNEARRLAQIGSWKLDPTTDTITWSAKSYRLTGWDPTRPPPSYWEHAQLFANDSWARMQVAVQSCLQTAAPYELDLELVRGDGATRRVLLRGEAEHDAEGRVVQLRGTVQDTTERTRAAQALRDSEERFRTIFDAVNDAIVVHDPTTGRLLEANQRAAELSGYTRDELLALDVGALSSGVSPFDQQDALAVISRAVEGAPQLVE